MKVEMGVSVGLEKRSYDIVAQVDRSASNRQVSYWPLPKNRVPKVQSPTLSVPNSYTLCIIIYKVVYNEINATRYCATCWTVSTP